MNRRGIIGVSLLFLFLLTTGFGPGGAGSQPGEVVVRFTAPPKVAPPADKTTGALWQYVAADKQAGGGRLAVLDWFAEQGLVGVEPLVHAPAGKAVKSKTPDELRTTSPIHRLVFAPDADVSAIVEQLGRTAGVLWAEPNWRGTLAYTPTDPLWSNQEAKYDVVGLREAWDIQQGAVASVRVAVIDTGIDAGHPEFDGVIDLAASYNFADGNATVADDNGHGTRIAGLIGARANNGEGIAGTAFGATLLSLDVATTDGAITSANVVSALQWAIAHDAHVAHLGFTFGLKSVALENACREASDAGILLVAAAGNRNQGSSPAYPASYDSVLGVGAVLDNGTTRAPWSNFNGSDDSLVDLVAPGEMVFSTIPGSQYNGTFGSGTSFAAPFVAGAAALLKSMYPDQSGAAIGAHLRATASPLGTWAGSGLLDAHAALATPMVPNVILVSVTVEDDLTQSAANDGDGIFDVGESVRLVVALHSTGAAVADVTATLSTASPHITTLGNATADFARIDHLVTSSNASSPFGLIVADGAAPAGDVPFLLELSAPGGFSASIPLNVRLENRFTAPAIIDLDMTWTNDRTWWIEDGCIVLEGATLTIEPGTTVRFADVPDQSNTLEIRGGIVSNGTVEAPVLFTSHNGLPTGGFEADLLMTARAHSNSIAIGDVDGDGYNDIVVSSSTKPWSVSFYRGGAFGFEPAVVLSVGLLPASISLGDINRDGYLEIIILNGQSNDISVYQWTGSGFEPERRLPVGAQPTSVAVGDLDNNGTTVIVTANKGSGDVSVIRWAGSDYAPHVRLSVGYQPLTVAIGDADGDGDIDLVVGRFNTLSIFRWNGQHLLSPISAPVASDVHHLAIGDANNDGQSEIVILHYRPAPSFSGPTSRLTRAFWTGEAFDTDTGFLLGSVVARTVHIADIGGKGRNAVLARSPGDSIALLRVVGNQFHEEQMMHFPEYFSSFTVGDANNDGYADIVRALPSSVAVKVWDPTHSVTRRHGGIWIRPVASRADFRHTTVDLGPVLDESTVALFEDFVADRAGHEFALSTTGGTNGLLRVSALGNSAGDGIRAGSKALTDCLAEDNLGIGLQGGLLTQSVARRNGGDGMVGSTTVDCLAEHNGNRGIVTSGSSLRDTARGNASWGVHASNGVTGAVATDNGHGIRGLDTVGFSTATRNAGTGILAARSATHCRSTHNGGVGFKGHHLTDCISMHNSEGGNVETDSLVQRAYIAENTGVRGALRGKMQSSVVIHNNGEGVTSSEYVRNSWIVGNGGPGVIGRPSPATIIESSAIMHNSGVGVRSAGPITSTRLHDNGGFDYEETRPSTELLNVDASGNYWGPESTAFMDAHPFGPGTTGNVPRIHDFRDDTSLAQVNYGGHLPSPVGAGPDTEPPAFLLSASTDRSDPLGIGLHELLLTYSEPMDMGFPLSVTWESETSYDSQVVIPSLGWQTDTIWRGTIVVSTQTPLGQHRLRVSGAVSADGFAVPDDTAHRFLVDAASLATANSGAVVAHGVDSTRVTWTENGRPQSALGFNVLATPREGVTAEALHAGQFALTRKGNTTPLAAGEFVDSGLAPGRHHLYAVYLVDEDSNALPWTGLLAGELSDSLSGTVVVEVTPESASWSFTDGGGNEHTGTGSGTVENVTVGNIVLTWQSLADHDTPTPNPETKSVGIDGTVVFNGAYVPHLIAVLAVTPSRHVALPTAGIRHFTVANTGRGNMAWQAEVVEGGAWARIDWGISGTNDGSIECAFDANDGPMPRTATIRVTTLDAPNSPVEVTIVQETRDDGNEPNNTWLEAQLGEGIRVGETVANLRSFDEDWYRIEFAPGESVRVRVLFNHAAGNLNAELYDIREFDENGVPFRVGESYSPNHPWVWSPTAGDGATAPQWNAVPWGPAHADDEWITYVNTTGASELYLRVYGEGGVENNNYAVAVDSLGTDDAFEPNDSIAQAKPIALDTRLEGLIGKNNDFFRVDVSGVDAIRVRVACYALLGTMYFEVHGMRPEGEVGPLEEGKMYEPNRYEASRTVCVQGLDEVFVRVYPSVRMPNVYNLVVETVSECP